MLKVLKRGGFLTSVSRSGLMDGHYDKAREPIRHAMTECPAGGLMTDNQAGSRRQAVLLALLLLAATLAVYWPVPGFRFTGLDDPLYVTENPHVLGGLSPQGVRWALTSFDAANWHPLTWLSLMLDASLGGEAPGFYHATNLVLHIVNVLLVFLTFDLYTRRRLRSAAVALLFAVHPLHVQSVAWVAERKDVLSTLFWFATLIAYAGYARRPSAARYASVLGLFACGLLAKPMLVTLPLVMLLLDVWPLGRAQGTGPARSPRTPWRRLVVEKLPMLAMAAVSSALTIVAQSRGGAVGSLEVYPLWARAANAVVSYIDYLRQMVLPNDLAVMYAHPGTAIGAVRVLVAAAVFAALTAAAVRGFRVRPYVTIGWLWYVVTLVPVIGLVQVGIQSRADRYTYIPLVGIFLAIVWLAADGYEAWIAKVRARTKTGDAGARLARAGAWLVAGAIVAGLAAVAHAQVWTWRDRRALFERLAAVEPQDAAAQNTLGTILFNESELDEAMLRFRRAIALDPKHAGAHNNVGRTLERLGKREEAAQEYEQAVRINPRYAEGHEHLARALLDLGRASEAVAHYRESLRLKPGVGQAEAGLAAALYETGDPREAAVHARAALAIEPRLVQASMVLGAALLAQQDAAGAAEQFAAAVKLAPTLVEAHANLGGALIAQGRFDEGIAACRDALRLSPLHRGARMNLAVGLAKQGHRDEATEAFRELLRIYPDDAQARGVLEQISGPQ